MLVRVEPSFFITKGFMMEQIEELKNKWKSFVAVVASPTVFISLISALVLIYLSIKYKNDPSLSLFTGLAGSFLAAVFGAFFKEGYAKLTEESILEKKGESAVRNIRSIQEQIIRVRSLINYFTSNKYKVKVPNTELKEISRHLETMSVSVASGLEDWKDIVPALKEEKEKNEALIEAVKPLVEDLFIKEREFREAKDTKTKEDLEGKIQKIKDDIERKKIQSTRYSTPLGGLTSVDTPTIGTGFKNLSGLLLGNSKYFNDKICSNCGKTFTGNSNYIGGVQSSFCPECSAGLTYYDET